MYDKRVKIFIAVSLALLLLCALRLAQMQLLADSRLQDEIAELKRQRSLSRQLKTVRGKIYDRNGHVLAADVPRFQLCINYRLGCYLDDRVVEAKRLEAAKEAQNPSLVDFYNDLEIRRNQINQIVVPACVRFGMSEQDVRDRIRQENDNIWNLRAFLAWYRSSHDPNLVERYGSVVGVPLSEAMADFERRFPPEERLRRIAGVDDIPEMNKSLPILELKTEDDIFAAQLEFVDVNDVEILPVGQRQYPYGSVASQTIGWVGLATQKEDTSLFEDDRLARYLKGEVCGREDGVEYVCEAILRGRRGELVYDIDRELVRQTETDYGDDVILTLDIELQKQIEESLRDPERNESYHDANMAAVVIDVASGDILAMVSQPSYDLNVVRSAYRDLVHDPHRPLINRAINKQYPPGSSIKPIILIAALETGLITAEEPIACPSHAAPAGWPDCLIFRRNHTGHSELWTNKARNAIKGSCNIYFSRLAERFEPFTLQRWLYFFGYGRPAPLACPMPPDGEHEVRQLRQAPGQIGSERIKAGKEVRSFDDIPPLRQADKRLFGIGQGNLWATPLQVASGMATIARRGLHTPPRLFLQPYPSHGNGHDASGSMTISPQTLAVVYEGMHAVVNERGGTAYDAFSGANLSRYGVQVYGKTGSTEDPEHAWFAGFAQDGRGREIAVTVVVEGGQHGSGDAAPLARHIIELCIDAGYVGSGTPTR